MGVGGWGRRPLDCWLTPAIHTQYIPKAEDTVLGVVEDRGAEQYRVNIFGRWVGAP